MWWEIHGHCYRWEEYANELGAVYVLDSHKDLHVRETFVEDVTKVLWEGRRAGAKTFYIAGDVHVELGLLCTDDDDVRSRNSTRCTARYAGKDVQMTKEASRSLMWYEIMKEFKCKATSTWSSCDDETEMAFTHRQFGKDGNGRTSQLDHILGAHDGNRIRCTCITTSSCGGTWDHDPIYVMIQEDDAQNYVTQKKKQTKT